MGSLLVVVADTIGRTVIAPAQIPVGVVTAVIGAPYFGWLLWRARADGWRVIPMPGSTGPDKSGIEKRGTRSRL